MCRFHKIQRAHRPLFAEHSSNYIPTGSALRQGRTKKGGNVGLSTKKTFTCWDFWGSLGQYLVDFRTVTLNAVVKAANRVNNRSKPNITR